MIETEVRGIWDITENASFGNFGRGGKGGDDIKGRRSNGSCFLHLILASVKISFVSLALLERLIRTYKLRDAVLRHHRRVSWPWGIRTLLLFLLSILITVCSTNLTIIARVRPPATRSLEGCIGIDIFRGVPCVS
jgi:hypothetical protein